MNISSIRAEIETDLSWRWDEVRLLQNQVAKVDDREKHDQFRRAAVVLLYAHFEGFCKFAMQVYLNAVNSAGLRCADGNLALAAATLADLFAALRDPSSKCDEFRNSLPDDTALHRFARDREFIERLGRFESRLLQVPETVVDTESNLKPAVLRKNLYRIGLPHDYFSEIEGDIEFLLKLRNKIAHGESRAGISEATYEKLNRAVYRAMSEIASLITIALREEKFRRTPAA